MRKVLYLVSLLIFVSSGIYSQNSPKFYPPELIESNNEPCLKINEIKGNLLFTEVRVDSSSEHQNETAIAFNPTNLRNLVAGFNDYRTGDTKVGFGVSTDGGLTWYDNVINEPTYTTQGDPSIACDSWGTFFMGILSFNRYDYGSGIFVARSNDGGFTWNTPVVVSTSYYNLTDKPYITVDNNPSSPYFNRIYIVWTLVSYSYDVKCSYSTDGGLSFSSPLEISDSYNGGFGAVPYVNSSGTLFVTWYDYYNDKIYIDKSTNGGVSFGTDILVSDIVPIGDTCPETGRPSLKYCVRVYSLPSMVIDTSGGPNNDNIYIVWADQRSGDPDILIVRSTNNGNSWSSPIRVNDDDYQNGIDQFFPWMTIDNQGNIFIVFYDSRNDPDNWLVDTYLAASTDGGQTFLPNIRVTANSFDVTVGFDGQFFGDYIGITTNNQTVFPCWTDSRNGQQDVYIAIMDIDEIIPGLTPTPTFIPTSTPIYTYTPANTPTEVPPVTNTPTFTPTLIPSFTPFYSPTSSIPTLTPTPTKTPFITPTPTASPPPPTSTPIPSPTFTSIPTLTPTYSITPTSTFPPQTFTTEIFTNQEIYHSGDNFILKTKIINNISPMSVDKYIVLDVWGQYWFWPSWSQNIDKKTLHYNTGIFIEEILNFIWPSNVGSASDIKFWLACFEPDTFNLIGNISYCVFGYE